MKMERGSLIAYPAKVEPEASLSELIKQVLQLVQRDGALSKKQGEFCDDACVIRYLKARANNVRRAARILRSTLNWRKQIDIGYIIADEFPAELAAGAAFVAGHDIEARPVLVIKKKPDYILNLTQKKYLRFIIFTMEVAVAAMPPGVDQWVLILDVGGYSTISAPSTSGILTTLKMLADYYPERLARAFIVDASSMFYYAWKGISTFVDHSTRGKLSFAYLKNYRPTPKPRLTSKISFLSSFSKHSRRRLWSFGSEKPRLPIPFRSKADDAPKFDTIPKRSEDDEAPDRLPEVVSSMRTSHSFLSSTDSITYPSPDLTDEEFSSFRKEYEDNVGEPEIPGSAPARPRMSKASSWDGLVAAFNPVMSHDAIMAEEIKNRDIDRFRPYFTFLMASYNDAAYRALMKPPLGGLATIVNRDLKPGPFLSS